MQARGEAGTSSSPYIIQQLYTNICVSRDHDIHQYIIILLLLFVLRPSADLASQTCRTTIPATAAIDREQLDQERLSISDTVCRSLYKYSTILGANTLYIVYNIAQGRKTS